MKSYGFGTLSRNSPLYTICIIIIYPSKYPHFAPVALSHAGLIEWTFKHENVLNQRFDPLNRMLVKWEGFLGGGM
jgi:hypothetical protein